MGTRSGDRRDLDKLASFLRKECKDADGLILSVDTLLYGGLIPSRIHHETKKDIAFPHGIDPGDQKRKSKYADLCVSGNYALSELFQQMKNRTITRGMEKKSMMLG